MQGVGGGHQRPEARRTGAHRDHGGTGDGEVHPAGDDERAHRPVGDEGREAGERGGQQFGGGLVLGEAGGLALGDLGHVAVVAQQVAADAVHPYLGGRRTGDQQLADEPGGPYVLHPGDHRQVAALRHPHCTPAARGGDQQQHGQQQRVQYGQHPGGGDQGDDPAEGGHAGADRAAGRGRTPLGAVQQPPELPVLDGLQLHLDGGAQVLLVRGPFDLGLQPSGGRGGTGGEYGPQYGDQRPGGEGGQGRVQPVGGAAPAQQGTEHIADDEQPDGGGDPLPGLGDGDGQQGRPIGVPGEAQGPADHAGHGAQGGQQPAFELGVFVVGPAGVVAQGPAEEAPFTLGDGGFGGFGPLEEPHARPPPPGVGSNAT